jgi:hypothetical protein
MSVNSTVARTRSISASSARMDVTNRRTASIMSSQPLAGGM